MQKGKPGKDAMPEMGLKMLESLLGLDPCEFVVTDVISNVLMIERTRLLQYMKSLFTTSH